MTYKCELRLNDENQELHIDTIEVQSIPRAGEYIVVVKKDSTKRFKVAEVWHFIKGSQKIVLYVNHTGR